MDYDISELKQEVNELRESFNELLRTLDDINLREIEALLKWEENIYATSNRNQIRICFEVLCAFYFMCNFVNDIWRYCCFTGDAVQRHTIACSMASQNFRADSGTDVAAISRISSCGHSHRCGTAVIRG